MEDKHLKTIFHLCKGMYKAIPVIGPILDEVIFEANKDLIYTNVANQMCSMSNDDVESLIQILLSFNNGISLRHWAFVKEKLDAYAQEYEDKSNRISKLLDSGDVAEAEEMYMQSAASLNKIINLYRAHKSFFDKDSRIEIDGLIDVDNEDDNEKLTDLIKAIQLFNNKVEQYLSTAGNTDL